MKLGIDFGTTRIVAAAVDRGNYPVITFEDSEGAAREWFPPVIASRDGERRYGWDAWAVQSEPGWTLIRSIKRSLEDAGPYTKVQIGGAAVPMLQLLQEMTLALKQALLDKSSLPGRDREPFEIFLGVPANANSNQRFLTVETFPPCGIPGYWLTERALRRKHRVRPSQSRRTIAMNSCSCMIWAAARLMRRWCSIDGQMHIGRGE